MATNPALENIAPKPLQTPSSMPRASLLENWIDEAEKRAWFLFEASRPATHWT